MNFSASRFRLALYGLTGLFGVWAIFYLPWKVPLSHRVESDSYNLGFNNLAALVGLTLTLIATFFCHLSAGLSRNKTWDARLNQLLTPLPTARSQYWIPVSFALLQCVAMWFWYRFIPTANYGEMGYTVSRLELILLGHLPYQNFEWNYGPLFLYLPVFIVRASHFRISSDESYIISLFVFTVLSFCADYYVLSQLNLNKKQKIIILFLLCSTFNLGLGANGTHMRFIAPYVGLLFLYSQSLKLDSNDNKQRLKFQLMMIVSIIFCFLISPETGVVFFVGFLCFCLVQLKNGIYWYRGVLLIVPAASIVPVLLFSRSYLYSMASFGGGAANFPILPTGQILFYLGSILFIVPLLAIYSCGNPNPQSALALGLGVMMTLFSAAALGRCDVGHIFFNGLGLFIICLALFAKIRSPLPFYSAGFFLFFTLSYPFTYFFNYGPTIATIAEKHARNIQKVDRNFFVPSFRERNPQLKKWQQSLAAFHQVGTPLGVAEDMEIMLKSSQLYVAEYYPCPSLEVRTEPQLKRKLADLEQMKYILVESKRLALKPRDERFYSRNQEIYLSQILLYFLSYQLKNEPFSPPREIVRYINAHFEKEAVFGPYTLLTHR